MDDSWFTNPGWVNEAVVAAPDSPMDLSLYANGALQILAWAEAWCHQQFRWVDIYEGPGERPLICPQDHYAYRLCARLPGYPHGMWVHVIVNQ